MPISKKYIAKINGKHPSFKVSLFMDLFPDEVMLNFYLKVGRTFTKRPVISVFLNMVSEEHWETHVWNKLPRKYRNSGFGIFAYSMAADFAYLHGYKISSSLTPSELAQRVWQSTRIRKEYKVYKRYGRYWIKPLQYKKMKLHTFV
jgi:hypothetical protein